MVFQNKYNDDEERLGSITRTEKPVRKKAVHM